MIGLRRVKWKFSFRTSIVLLLIILSFAIQIFATIVDYRRYLITAYESTPQAFEENWIIFHPRYSPLIGQIGAVLEVAGNRSQSRTLQPYIAPGPWINSGRPASQKMMLSESIDLNSWNFWWARMKYLPVSDWIKWSTSILFVLLLSIITIAGIKLICTFYGLRCRSF